MKTFLRLIIKILATIPMLFIWAVLLIVGYSMLAYVWLFEVPQTNLDIKVTNDMKRDHNNFIKKWFTKI